MLDIKLVLYIANARYGYLTIIISYHEVYTDRKQQSFYLFF